MDSSLTKALIMVAGVLLAMLVIAFVAHSFGQVGGWAQTQDEEILIEQKEKFNKEYEVFDKDLMYGVDVISCLNKAYSNNERIADKRFISGETYDNVYEVKVKVTLKKELEESITVYYMEEKGAEHAYLTDDGPTTSPTVQLGNLDPYPDKPNEKFLFLDKDYKQVSNFNENSKLQTKSQKCKESYKQYELTAKLNGNSGVNEASLRKLLSVSGTLSEIKRNKNTATSNIQNGWTKAKFESALYDLKTRKFKCSKLEYNTQSGRVNKIEFTEM